LPKGDRTGLNRCKKTEGKEEPNAEKPARTKGIADQTERRFPSKAKSAHFKSDFLFRSLDKVERVTISLRR
jgi:hypothetical protein